MALKEKNGHANGVMIVKSNSQGQLNLTDGKTEMKKSVGLFSGTALIVGTMIGKTVCVF
jgi:hypothetical protein